MLIASFNIEISVISATGVPAPITEPKSIIFLVIIPLKGEIIVHPLICFNICAF